MVTNKARRITGGESHPAHRWFGDESRPRLWLHLGLRWATGISFLKEQWFPGNDPRAKRATRCHLTRKPPYRGSLCPSPDAFPGGGVLSHPPRCREGAASHPPGNMRSSRCPENAWLAQASWNDNSLVKGKNKSVLFLRAPGFHLVSISCLLSLIGPQSGSAASRRDMEVHGAVQN